MAAAHPIVAASPSPPPLPSAAASPGHPSSDLHLVDDSSRHSNVAAHSHSPAQPSSPVSSARKPRGLSISTRAIPPIPPPHAHDPPSVQDGGSQLHYTCDPAPASLDPGGPAPTELPKPSNPASGQHSLAAESIPTWGPVTLHEDPASIVSPLSSKVLTPEQVQLVQQALERHVAIGDSIMQFGLGVLDMDRFEQYGLLLAMARRLRIPILLRVTLDQLLDWAVAVDSLYLPNPYHSFAHAVDVTFMCFFTFVNLHAADLVTDLEQTAVFFAALCHDLGHPGKNNTFMINTKHSLAARYHNQSVLENYSVDLGRDLMLQHGLLAHMSGATRDVFIDMFTDLILGTDMSKHFALVKDLGELSRQLLHADHLVTLAEEEQQQGSAGSLSGDGRPEITIAPAATQRDAPTMLTQSVTEALDRMARGSPTPTSPAGATPWAGTDTAHIAPLMPTMHSSSSVTFPAPPAARKLSSSKSATLYSQRQDDAQAPLSSSGNKMPFTVASTNVLSPSIQLPWAPLVQSSYDSPGSSSDDHTHPPSSTVDLSGPATGTPSDAFAAVQLLAAPHRRNLVKCLLHAADISNTVRPWDLCKRWSDLVEKEHFAQGDAELALGFALSSPNMDRRSCQQAKVSMDFSDVIIHPFFVLLADVLPGTELYLDQLAVNRALWEQIRERDKMHRAAVSKAGHAHEVGDEMAATSAYQSVVSSPVHASAFPPGAGIGSAASAVCTASVDTMATDSTDSIASSTATGHGGHDGGGPPAGYTRGRRVSVAAGTIVIPEHYFRAAATTPLEGSPTDPNAPDLPASYSADAESSDWAHNNSPMHVLPTGSQDLPSHSTVTPPPRSTTPPIPIPMGSSSISLPNTPISGPRSTARSNSRINTDAGTPLTSAANDEEEFDALYLEYLARAQSRRRATHASLHMDPHTGFSRVPHHSTSVPTGAILAGSQSLGGSRSLSPVSGGGTGPPSSSPSSSAAGAAADPTAFRRYSLEASERQRRRKSTVALRHLPLLTSAHVMAGPNPSLGSIAMSTLPVVPNGVPFMGQYPSMAAGLSPTRLAAGSAASRRATSLDTSGIVYPGHGISYSMSALGSASPLSPSAHAGVTSGALGQQGIIGGFRTSQSGAVVGDDRIPPVPPVPNMFAQGFYIATRGPHSSSTMAAMASPLTPQSEGPLEPASTPVAGMNMAARLLRGDGGRGSGSSSPAPASAASDPGPSHRGGAG